ncbi:ATP synthase F0 subunit B [Candidatus Nomurabacteria bacterium RIFCSPLOWO2_02_FULL_44_12]|uniref:ATP synthase subunit b n=1 Tax=Candidatus Nomurabacteria bacterium RIFCSPLOWO2_12_FULL_44_11 TaxID=1801796 RepID=A0A1F6Y6V0_9BACT|nr:MAG: ATP synthase F0 subunit B [Candidatus Nomurabacteria bacterium RIFCSPHIGHO2_12_FULL_44_22b]OGJ02069.1 MAG: ATP synthase F0 subunit B [Candidatus Nomurabacteria bacterium RIFCSPLOWO2_12_FULL_44_11]OGJ08712.1 MAG: ATP synthase F0 subunit B [Candidatus Nomurabacteria bacterium RIFCSPLOWO2_02_FULL_44_12]
MESIVSTFHIDWKIIIAQAVNFAVVFVVLYIFALKPLQKLMTERSERINKGLTDAKANALMLEQSKKEHEEILAKARVEAQKIFESGKKETEGKKIEMIEEAKQEVATIIVSGRRTLEMDKIKIVADAKKEIVELTMLTTEKLLKSKQNLNDL